MTTMMYAAKAIVLPLISLSLISDAQMLQEGDVCSVLTMIPFTDQREGPTDHADEGVNYYGYGNWPNQETLGKASFSLLVAAEMAKRHFNQRDPSIVPELADLGYCNITIPEAAIGDYMDSGYDRRYTVRQLLNKLGMGNGGDEKKVCGIVGPVDPYVAAGVSVYSEAMRVPQVAYSTVSYRLSQAIEYPSFSRVIPEAYDFGATVAKFFQRDAFQRETAGIIYDDTDYGEQFESPLEDLEDELDYVTITESFSQGDDEGIRAALQEALDNGYRTIVFITDRTAEIDDMARLAEEMGMLGEGYFWILSGEALPPAMLSSIKYDVDSPADKLLRGAALFTNYDRFVYLGEADPFLTAWREQGETVELSPLLAATPNGTDISPFSPDSTYFQTEMPSEYASFIYDAVMTVGISACEASRSIEKDETPQDLLHNTKVLQSRFQGASGTVKFKADENSRDPDDVVFGIYNIVPGDLNENGQQSYETVLTHLYSKDNEYKNEDGEVQQGAWEAVPGTEFLFFDGTPNEPLPRRETFDSHFLSMGVQVAGLFLSSLALLLILLSGAWVFFNRDSKLTRASQPEFLYLLCLGCAMIALSTIFVSFDESRGFSDKQLDGMCSAFPWFFVIGYLISYSALFSKLWRLSKLLRMRRQSVNVRHVILPFGMITTCSFAILMVWQVLDPLRWNRETISVGEEPFETFGECSSKQHGSAPFLIPLSMLIFVAVGTTAWFSWKLREVQAELAETRWIFAGIFIHIQIWLIGVPLLFLTRGVSRDASYVMQVVLSFTFSVSLVGFLIWPKIVHSIRKRFDWQSKSSTSINLGGSSTRVSGISQASLRMSNSGLSLQGSFSNHQDQRTRALTDQKAQLVLRVAELEELLDQAGLRAEQPLKSTRNVIQSDEESLNEMEA